MIGNGNWSIEARITFRNASIDGGEVTLWVRRVGFSNRQEGPLLIRSLLFHCGAVTDVEGPGCVKTCSREHRAELVSVLSPPDMAASGFVFQVDEVETKFLTANSISEFSHSLGQGGDSRGAAKAAVRAQTPAR